MMNEPQSIQDNPTPPADSQAEQMPDNTDFNENSEAVIAEEARLDALDANPENKKRSLTILIIILVLAALGMAVVIIYPPLSWKPKKHDAGNFRMVAEITQAAAENPANDAHPLRYHAVAKEQRYRFSLEQASEYPGRQATRTTLAADVLMNRPERRHSDDEVTIKLDKVEAHVFDAAREVTLASPGAMLQGVALYSRIDASLGLGTVVPDANINPQVARVLYIVADSLRFVWIPLPQNPVSAGSTWKFADKKDTDIRFVRNGESKIASLGDVTHLETAYELQALDGTGTWQNVGRGTVSAQIRDGAVMKAQGEITRDSIPHKEGAQRQSMRFDLTYMEIP